MHSVFETAPSPSAIPITFATRATWNEVSATLHAQARQFAQANGFAAKASECLTLPTADGRIAQVLFGLEDDTAKWRDLFRPGQLPGMLPPGWTGGIWASMQVWGILGRKCSALRSMVMFCRSK